VATVDCPAMDSDAMFTIDPEPCSRITRAAADPQ
jgi:hypothetical protein